MTDLLQLLIAGLATGAIYALAAIGFTLLWQTSQTINFAQGEFVMVPAFLALIAMRWFGVPFLGALVLAVLASMLLLGVVFRFVVVAPLIRRGVVPLLVIVLLQWFLAGTRTGRQMQATAQNPDVARILGVPVERMILYTFLINAALAVMASLLISPIYLAKFSNGE